MPIRMYNELFELTFYKNYYPLDSFKVDRLGSTSTI